MRNSYYNDAELTELEAHDLPEVRKVVDLVRDLSAELLLVKMLELGKKYNRTDKVNGLDLALWYALQNGPERISEIEVAELDQLSQMASGWWRLQEQLEPEFLSFEDWLQVYRE